jgi:hypothetical protein
MIQMSNRNPTPVGNLLDVLIITPVTSDFYSLGGLAIPTQNGFNYMDKEPTAVDTPQTAAPETIVPPTIDETGDTEALIAKLEAEKAKAIEEAANYKLAFLKEKSRKDDDFENETEEERTRRLVQEELSRTKIAQIDAEKEELLLKLARENKELKLANLNKTTTPPASMGSHSESIPSRDTLVTPEQLDAFKARGWTDQDIERYKKNLQRYGGR